LRGSPAIPNNDPKRHPAVLAPTEPRRLFRANNYYNNNNIQPRTFCLFDVSLLLSIIKCQQPKLKLKTSGMMNGSGVTRPGSERPYLPLDAPVHQTVKRLLQPTNCAMTNHRPRSTTAKIAGDVFHPHGRAIVFITGWIDIDNQDIFTQFFDL
jgi:hypothetical protein